MKIVFIPSGTKLTPKQLSLREHSHAKGDFQWEKGTIAWTLLLLHYRLHGPSELFTELPAKSAVGVIEKLPWFRNALSPEGEKSITSAAFKIRKNGNAVEVMPHVLAQRAVKVIKPEKCKPGGEGKEIADPAIRKLYGAILKYWISIKELADQGQDLLPKEADNISAAAGCQGAVCLPGDDFLKFIETTDTNYVIRLVKTSVAVNDQGVLSKLMDSRCVVFIAKSVASADENVLFEFFARGSTSGCSVCVPEHLKIAVAKVISSDVELIAEFLETICQGLDFYTRVSHWLHSTQEYFPDIFLFWIANGYNQFCRYALDKGVSDVVKDKVKRILEELSTKLYEKGYAHLATELLVTAAKTHIPNERSSPKLIGFLEKICAWQERPTEVPAPLPELSGILGLQPPKHIKDQLEGFKTGGQIKYRDGTTLVFPEGTAYLSVPSDKSDYLLSRHVHKLRWSSRMKSRKEVLRWPLPRGSVTGLEINGPGVPFD